MGNHSYQTTGRGHIKPPYPYLVFAANKEPKKEIDRGSLREDFWGRLCQFAVRVPALRERLEDIPAFLKASKKKARPRTLLALLKYDWPNNIRELVNTLKLSGQDEHLRVDQLPNQLQQLVANVSREDAEREVLGVLIDILARRGYAKGDRRQPIQKKIAEMLGVSPAWVSGRLKAYGLA